MSTQIVYAFKGMRDDHVDRLATRIRTATDPAAGPRIRTWDYV